ncbi:MAG TPA: sugar ABC transporter permease [Streptosporangiaceae bacterium]|jgi:multiple sugar transport system permease protein|nr:sugar ABC transporter permease [Streptosporangiaceae bacterium]
MTLSRAKRTREDKVRPAAATVTPPRRRRRPVRPRLTPYLLVLPAVVFELLVHVIPMAAGIWMSFVKLTEFFVTDWLAAPFAGLHNYSVALDFHGPLASEYLTSFGYTLAFTVLVVGLSFGFGLLVALVLQRGFRGRGTLRTLFLVPYALPAYVSIITWKFIFQRDNGLFNQVLSDLHLIGSPRPFWLLGGHAFFVLVLVAFWQQWPFAFLMTMAGMQSIPEDLYQAAAIDGAGTWQQARHVTLGLLKPINSVLVLLLFLWTFREFNTPYVLFGAAPPVPADLLVVHIYSTSFVQLNFGLGSAMSVLLMLFLILCAALWAGWNRRVSRDA